MNNLITSGKQSFGVNIYEVDEGFEQVFESVFYWEVVNFAMAKVFMTRGVDATL